MIAPPTISFVTVTTDTVTVAIVPPTDITFDHVLVFTYDVVTGALVDTSAPVFGPSYTTPALSPNRAYAVVATAIDTGGETSLPSNQLISAETDAHNDVIANPKVLFTNIVQESRTKVRIEYRLEDAKDLLGELVNAEYSYNGLFTDAVSMKESSDIRHNGRFFLQFRLPPFIIDPQHFFIWDISEIPDNTVHTFKIRFRGKSGAIYTSITSEDVDIDTTVIPGDVPAPVVVTGTSLTFQLPLFQGQTPLSGATVTVTQIRNDADVNLLGAPVVAPELIVPNLGIYQVAIPIAYAAGRYRVFFTIAGVGYSSSGTRVMIVVPNTYDISFGMNVANLCLVYGKLVDDMDRPLVNSLVRATYTREPSRYDRVSSKWINVYTNEFGFFALHLLQGTEVVLEITDLEYEERLKIPVRFAAQFSSIQFNQPSTLVRDAFGHVRPPEEQ